MTNSNQNQQIKAQADSLVKKVALWLYTNAERVEYHLKTALDVIGFFIGLAICFGLLLIAGAM